MSERLNVIPHEFIPGKTYEWKQPLLKVVLLIFTIVLSVNYIDIVQQHSLLFSPSSDRVFFMTTYFAMNSCDVPYYANDVLFFDVV